MLTRLTRQLTLFLLLGLPAVHAGWDQAGMERMKAMQLTPDYDRGRVIYETCEVCHMREGWGTPNGAYPQIAGQHRSVVIKQLADIRAKNRDNPSMYPFAIPEVLGGAQAIADVAHYIEGQKMTSATGKGEGLDLLYGERLYHRHCSQCHGAWGEGDSNHAYPALRSQHYRYLLRQLSWINSGKRRNVNLGMMQAMKGFGSREYKAVSDYISRLPVTDKGSARQASKDPWLEER